MGHASSDRQVSECAKGVCTYIFGAAVQVQGMFCVRLLKFPKTNSALEIARYG